MPIRLYKCPICGYQTKAKRTPRCAHGAENPEYEDYVDMQAIITTPSVKLQETDAYTGKTQMQDQERILKARARNYSRDNDLDDLIQKNDAKSAQQFEWLKEGGRKRKAIDDI